MLRSGRGEGYRAALRTTAMEDVVACVVATHVGIAKSKTVTTSHAVARSLVALRTESANVSKTSRVESKPMQPSVMLWP